MNQEEIQKIIYGKTDIKHVVSCEIHDGSIKLFQELPDGTENVIIKPFKYWALAPKRLDSNYQSLKGDLWFKYIKFYDNQEKLRKDKFIHKKTIYSPANYKEMAMLYYGFTYFKDLTIKDVSCLSFDIETNQLHLNNESKVILISNTYRKGEKLIKKLFCYDEYTDEGEMIKEWCNWVREVNPTILLGHNIFGFDLPFLAHVASMYDVTLDLGRDGSPAKFSKYESKFRKDQSQDYHYHNCEIYGRELVDTSFLSIKYDIAAKKYESYGLKNIIKQEGLEKEGRQFYDASQIRFHYKDPVELKKIKAYCEDDSMDALALFDLMIPSFFYLNRTVPKPLQSIINGATGAQIDSILIRSYLQDNHSIPDSTKVTEFLGGISLGNPGLYTNCFKIDVASLYPSIIIQYEIYDDKKDPKGNFKKMVKTLTEERLKNKSLSQTTGNLYYKDLEQSQKITINSCFGMMGASGLKFNSPENAGKITRIGREILQYTMEWLENG